MVFIKHIKINSWKPYTAYDSEVHLNHADTFSKINFIFGENGVGKSTFTNILKHYGKGNLIGQDFSTITQQGEIGFVLDGSTATDDLEGNIIVFDRDFVADNIFIPGMVGQSSTNFQRQARGNKIKFGRVGIIEEQISAIEEQQKALDKSGKEKRFGTLHAEINKYEGVSEISEQGILEFQSNQKSYDECNKFNEYRKILLTKISSFLDKNVAGIIAESTLKTVKSPEKIIRVIKDGTSFIEENKIQDCPFCKQSLPSGIESYWHSILHDVLVGVQKEVDDLIRNIKEIPNYGSLNKDKIIEIIDNHSKGISGDLNYIDTVNDMISKDLVHFSTYFQSKGDLAKAIEYTKLKTQYQIATQEKDIAITEYSRLGHIISEKKQEKIDEYNTYKDGIEEFINQFLFHHGINYFKIAMVMPAGVGRGHTQSLIDFEIQSINDEDDVFSIKNMSEGEQRVLGLGFFFFLIYQQIQSDPNFLRNKIIILDDPMTSFDKDKRKHLSKWIKENFIGEGVFSSIDQLFILTHDDLFYKYLCKEYNIGNPRKLRINKGLGGASIVLFNITNKFNEYKACIQQFIQDVDDGITITEINKECIGQVCRNSVDYIIRKEFFPIGDENTSQILNYISADQFSVKVESNKQLLKDLAGVYQFNSQNGTTHTQDESTTTQELYDYSKKLLELITAI